MRDATDRTSVLARCLLSSSLTRHVRRRGHIAPAFQAYKAMGCSPGRSSASGYRRSAFRALETPIGRTPPSGRTTTPRRTDSPAPTIRGSKPGSSARWRHRLSHRRTRCRPLCSASSRRSSPAACKPFMPSSAPHPRPAGPPPVAVRWTVGGRFLSFLRRAALRASLSWRR